MSTMIVEHPPPKDDRACICRICNCGKHHCPGLVHMAPLGGMSSYRDHYPGKQPEPNDRSVPAHRQTAMEPTKAAPGHFQTTNQAAQEAARGCPIEKTESAKPRQLAVARQPFVGNTSYQNDYPGHDPALNATPRQGAPTQAMPRAAALPGTFETTNQAANNALLQAQRDGTLQRASPAKASDSNPLNRNVPFDGQSVYRQEYPGHQPQAATTPRRAPENNLRNAPDNRDFLTSNGAAYQKPPQEKQPMCPACFAPRRPPSTDGHIKVIDVPDGFGNITPSPRRA